jgi:predicted metallo-beta-lactamase superfamily hydrolase
MSLVEGDTMLRKIKVVPLAAESMGVRSMCTYVETPDVRVLLDAGVSLSPSRFRLPPHPLEFQAIKDARRKLADYADKADVVTISHYHFDHHTPSYEDWLCNWTNADIAHQIYAGKLVLAKSYQADVNPSQRRRGWMFQKTGGRHARKLEFADGKSFAFGETTLTFSPPVAHGVAGTPLGWVLMALVEHHDERVMFASDVQGPMDEATLQHILAAKPHLVILGGPPMYLAGFRVSELQLKQGLAHLETLARSIPTVVVEHHLLRDAQWREWAKAAFASAQTAGNKVLTAAELVGKDDRLLEAERKQLYEKDPPSREFERWSKLPEQKRRKTKPPV